MDIVERLRNFETSNVDLLFLKNDAAFEIERLRDEVDFQLHKRKEDAAEIERLREALADIANIVNPYEDGDTMQEIARAALKEKE